MHIKTMIDGEVATRSGKKKFTLPAIIDKDGNVFIKDTNDVFCDVTSQQLQMDWIDDVKLYTLIIDDLTNKIGKEYISFSSPLKSGIQRYLRYMYEDLDTIINVSLQRSGLFLVQKRYIFKTYDELYIMREEDVTYIATTERQTFLRKIV
jgi:hypothetical protein